MNIHESLKDEVSAILYNISNREGTVINRADENAENMPGWNDTGNLAIRRGRKTKIPGYKIDATTRYRINGARGRISRHLFLPLVFFLASASLPVKINAQNVGIGTASPAVRLHVISNVSSPARFDGGDNMFIGLYEAGIYRGYIGSYSGAAADVDFGTGAGNTTGNVQLTIQASPKFTLDNSGNVGIGNTNPPERLTIGSGNLMLQSSLLGVMLNASDRPLITRGWDAFSSGVYNGIGRWGLFMEPSRLTLGIPNLSGKAVEIAKYNTNSTRTTLMTVNDNGEVQRPPQGSSDLLPVCIGSVDVYGNILGGSGNFSVSKDLSSGQTLITVTGVTYIPTEYAVIATCFAGTPYGNNNKAFAEIRANAGKIEVVQYTDGGTQSNQAFSFVVYRL